MRFGLKALGGLLCSAFLLMYGAAANATAITYSTAQSEFLSGTYNQGWWSSGPGHTSPFNDNNDNHFTGLTYDGDTLRSFYTFDLSGLTGYVTNAVLSLRHSDQANTVNLSLWDVSTPADIVNRNGGLNLNIFNDLGSGKSYGSFVVPTGGFNRYFDLALNDQALQDINAAKGFFTIGASVDPGQAIFGNSGEVDDVVYLKLNVEPVSPLSEPTTLAMLGLGAVGLSMLARRKAKQI